MDFDPSFLPPVPSVREERVFTAKGGQAFTVAFEVSSGQETNLFLSDRESELLAAYGPESGFRFGSPPVKVSRSLCGGIAAILMAEVAPEGADAAWTPRLFPWWATLAQRDAETYNKVLAFRAEVENFAYGLNRDGSVPEDKEELSPEDRLKNDSGALAADSSQL